MGYMAHKEYYDQFMDFSSLKDKGIFPSDLDMVYMCEDGYLIIGEIKYIGNHVQGKQEQVLTGIIDGHSYDGCLLEIEHHTRIQESDRVDVADCKVVRAYFNEVWHTYRKPLSVLQWMTMLNNKHGGLTRV